PDHGPGDAITEPLDELLRQIINGYFVLTDGNGAVSKWSEPAELLFGRASQEILGLGFFETLIGGGLPPAGQAWRAFLGAGAPPAPWSSCARCSPRRASRPRWAAARPSAPPPARRPRSA